MNILKHALVISALIAATALPGQAQQGSTMPSPHDSSSARVSGKLVTIYYGRPYAKGRPIWGGQNAPWDKAYRLGANEATMLITEGPLNIGGTDVPAGAYRLYMIPSEKGVSKLAINKTIGVWGIKRDNTVDEQNDLARVDLKKDDLEEPVEQLTITLTRNGPGALLKIAWIKNQYSVEIKPGQ